MKTLITAAVLALASNVVQADGFAPWETREVRPDVVTDSADVAPIGFAPWREINQLPDMPDTDVRFSVNFGSVFRPWS